MDLGQAVKKLRKDRNIKQYQMAMDTGMTQSYLSQIENNKKTPSVYILMIMANYFNIPTPVLVWYSLTESDVPEEKINHFFMVRATINGLLDSVFSPSLEG